MSRNIVVAAIVLSCCVVQAHARSWFQDETSVVAVIDFTGNPSGRGGIKEFTNGSPVAFAGQASIFDKASRPVLGRILRPSISLTSKPDGTVLLTFEHIAMSGDREHAGRDGYFTGNAQRTFFGRNMGGIAWTIEVYDEKANARPIYVWDWNAEKRDHEEIKCGVTETRSFSIVIRPKGPLSPQQIFSRAARVSAVAAEAEWTHC